MAKRYIKNSEGIVSAVTTENLQLEKPLINENYDIEVHNRNMDKIDKAIQEVVGEASTNKTNISDLQTKVNNGQNHKLTRDSGYCIDISNKSIYDISSNGFFMGCNVANAPTTNWIYIESLVHNNLHQVLTVIDLHDSSKRWTAHKVSGIWSEWREL